MKDRTHAVYSFISYKGGSARTSALVNCALGLVVQGQDVLLIDLDMEAPGLPIFSSVKEPDPLFQPNHLYALDDLRTPISDRERRRKKEINLKGWLSVLDADDPGDELDRQLGSLPIYECRSPYRHPLEGRLFLLPLGGRFQYAKPKASTVTTVEATEWIYCPPDGHDLKILLELQRSNWLLSEQHRFFERLVEASVESIREIGVELDHVLLDERPGISLRSLLASAKTDGVVVVGSGSRGNLAGLGDFVERFAERADSLPPVTGIILSPLLEEVTSDTGSAVADPLEALQSHFEQLNLPDSINKLVASGNVQLPSQDQCPMYSDLLRESYVFPGTAFPGDSKEETKAVHSLWGSAWQSQRALAQAVDRVNLVLFDKLLFIYDRPLGIREFAQTGLSHTGDVPTNLQSITLMVGHLRHVNRDRDLAYRAWSLLRQDIHSTKENDWTSTIGSARKPWRYFWYKAVWHETRAEHELAWEFLNQAVDLQREQCGTLDPTWPGDWRLFLKSARLLRRFGETWYTQHRGGSHQDWNEQVENQYRSAISSLEHERGAYSKDGLSGRQVDLIANIHQELARHLAGKERATRDDVNEAYHHYRVALEDGCVLRELLNGVVDFLIDNRERLSEADSFEFVEAHLEKLAKRHDLRVMLVMPLARLQLDRYWATPIKENRKFLDDAIQGLRDWEQLRAQGLVSVDARGPGLLGEALLEAATHQTSVLQYHHILQAIEQFEKATQQNLPWFPYHLYLGVSRILEYTNPNSPFRLREENRTSLARDSVDGAPGDELNIRKRDAFYAFEQAVALKANPESPRFYFEGNDAKELADLLPSAIHTLSDIHGDSTFFNRIRTLFARFLPPEHIRTDSLRRAEHLLGKAGLHRDRGVTDTTTQREARPAPVVGK